MGCTQERQTKASINIQINILMITVTEEDVYISIHDDLNLHVRRGDSNHYIFNKCKSLH